MDVIEKGNNSKQNVNIVDETTKMRELVRFTLIVLICTLGVFLGWAAFVPIDQGAPAVGLVTVANYKKVIQHPYGGTVKEILVKEGDVVKRGQVLIKLEDSEIRARYTNVKAEYIFALVVYSRLQAERVFMPKIVYPEEVLKMRHETEVKKVIHVQEQLFRSRRMKLETEKGVIMESVRGLKDYAVNLQKQKEYYLNQLRIVEKQMESLRDLSSEGYFPKNRLLELERIAEELRGKIAEITANQVRAEASVSEYILRANALEREYLKDVESELAEVEKRLLALRDSYNAVKDMLEKTEIKSPDDGIVMALKVHTIGQVIQPGHTIMEIVPENSELIIEGKLSPTHIEEVKVGQEVDLRFVTLDPKKTPVLEGVLIYVSPDVLFDELHKSNYYLVKVKIKEESIHKLRELNKEIIPGIPVQIIIKTGRGTFLSYLLKPFIDRIALAFLK